MLPRALLHRAIVTRLVAVLMTIVAMAGRAPTCDAQPWQRVGADVASVAVAGNILLAVGDHGMIMRSTDGGVSWSLPTSHVTGALRQVAFSDAVTAVAAGDSAVVLRSTDEGGTWSRTTIAADGAVTALTFAANGRGFAIDQHGLVHASTDAGATWTAGAGRIPASVLAVVAVNASQLIAVGDSGRIVRTTDGGASWSVTHRDRELHLTSVEFIDDSVGYVGGLDGALLTTVDGGATWSQLTGLRGLVEILSITARSDGRVIVTGAYGSAGGGSAIATSSDAGETWTARPLPYPILTSVLLGAAESSGDTVVAAGNLGTLIRSTNGGDTFTAISSATLDDALGQRARLTAVASNGGDTAVAVNGISGGAGWTRTTDGGVTWRYGLRPNTNTFRDPTFFDDTTVIVATEDHASFLSSSDAGTTWRPYPSTRTPSSRQTWGVQFIDGMLGIMTGDSIVYMTSDRGTTWTGRSIEWASELVRAHAVTDRSAHVIARNASVDGSSLPSYRVYRTADGGATWSVVLDRSDAPVVLTDLHFADTLCGFVCGTTIGADRSDWHGFLLRTTDGGRTWDSLPTPAGVPNRIRFFNDRQGFMVGGGLAIWETTDGGVTWAAEHLPGARPDDVLLDVAVLQNRRVLVVSGAGVLGRRALSSPIPSVVEVPGERLAIRPSGARLRVAPVPVRGRSMALRLEGGSDLCAGVGASSARVALHDMLGAPVMIDPIDVDRLTGEAVVDVEGLHPGVYVVVVTCGARRWSATVVVGQQ